MITPVRGSPLWISPTLGKINLIHSSKILEDPEGKLTIDEVVRFPWAGRFTPQGDSGNNLGMTRSAFWIRLDLEFSGAYPGRYLLEVPYPPLDELTAYLPDGEGGMRVVETGDRKPFSHRDVENHDFVFQLPGGLEGRSHIFLRVANHGAIIVPLYLWQEQAFSKNEQTEQLVRGIYFGILVALAVSNLFIYFSIRDTSYLWYVGYLSSIGLFLFVYNGLAVQFFWPNSPEWGNHSLYIFVAVTMFSGLGFARKMLNLPMVAPRLGKIILWVAWAMLLFPIVGLFLDKFFLIALLPCLGMLTFALLATAVTLSIRAQYKPAWFVGLAFAALLPGGLLLSLRALGLVPDNLLTANSMQIGVAMEALLLSFALAYRIRLLNEQVTHSQQAMVEAKRDFARQLIDARDTELRRTASELHDGIGQNLLVVSNRLQGLSKQAGDILPQEKLRFLLDIVQETINDIRRMSHRLHPHQLERLGLKSALEETISRTFEDTEIQVDCQIADLHDVIDPHVKLQIYRIVQEAIKNIINHSNASRTFIKVKRYSSSIDIWIEDNGKGIDVNAYFGKTQTPSFGLASIEERVQLLKGELEYGSTDGSGFAILVTLPISPKND